MPKKIEPLNGGLVTNRDPALLREGELSDIRNAVYRKGKVGLSRAFGRTAYATASTDPIPVLGMRSIKFDNGGHFLIAQLSNSAYLHKGVELGPAGNVLFGTITDTTLVTGAQLEAVHYRNQWYLFNGAKNNDREQSTNRVLFLSATATAQSNTPAARPHGLLPVQATPTATLGVGTANIDSGQEGHYEYWTTEVREYTIDGQDFQVESGFVGKPATINIGSTSTPAVIRKPDRVNDFANRWRVYRSVKKESASAVAFPSGFLVSTDLSVGVTTFTDSIDTSATAFYLPGSFNTSPEPYSGWVSASNLSVDDTSYAVSTVGTSGGNSQGCYAFSFDPQSGNLAGIEVEIEAYASVANTPITVLIGVPRLSTGYFPSSSGFLRPGKRIKFGSKSTNVSAITSATAETITLGSPTDLWVGDGDIPFTSTDLNDNFMVVLQHSQPSTTMNVNYVKVKAYTGGSSISTIPFPTVVYQIGNEDTVQIARKGPPPSSSTGDMFGSQLVVNDVNEPNNLKYSYPDDPDAFPSTYYFSFDFGNNDRITNIKVVNNRLMVFLENGSYRVNYLPSEVDASFDRERAIVPLSSTYGCVNEMCAVKFSTTGLGEQLAFVSNSGIHVTDGETFETITDTLDWTRVISRTNRSECIALINNAEEHELVFYYRNDDDPTKTYLALHFSYAPEHMSGGRMKVSGPVLMRNYDGTNYAGVTSAWPATRADGSTKVFLGYGPSPEVPQYATASGDVSAGGWTPGSGASLYLMIDEAETVINDNETAGSEDYITILDNSGSPTCTIGLTAVTDPIVSNDHRVRLRCRKTNNGGSSISSAGDYITVSISDGSSTFFTRNAVIYTSGYATFDWTLTDAEATAITNAGYGTLRASFSFTSSTSGGTESFRIAWFNFKIPALGSSSTGAGLIYVEGGASLPVDDPAMSYTTRRMYLAGHGGEMTVKRLYGYVGNTEGTPTIAYSLKTSKTNFPGEAILTSPEVTLGGQFLHRVNMQQSCEGLRVTMDVLADHNDMTQDFLIIEGDGFPEEHSGL